MIRNNEKQPLVEDKSHEAEAVGSTRSNTHFEFINESIRDFSDEKQRQQFKKSITSIKIQNTKHIDTQDLDSYITRAKKAQQHWQATAVYQRSAALLRAADNITTHRDAIAGVIIREAGKTWREADAEVCEAIDFLRYYARCAIELSIPEILNDYPGEFNEHWIEPRGIVAVIAPWNFPLAIPLGMTVAALATGNAVILKPAEQTPYIAKMLVEKLHQSGIPKDILHLAPGLGETIGAQLVSDSRISTIAFTGSRQVGLNIIKTAYDTKPDQHFIKRVICEMGGKNAIIVDDSADLDQAIVGVRDSAFGFAGQKCSACSRCIVLESIHDSFVDRLVAATKTLEVGDPINPGTDIGPLIDQEAEHKAQCYINIGHAEGHCALAMSSPLSAEPHANRPFVGPHIFTGIQQHHSLANDEIFAPVLAVIKAKTFDEAIHIANATDYKLTGGVYTRKPSHLTKAKREFNVGNLYLNRNITGALVARQPFGGFGLSGIGEKAGGVHYLRQFTVPRVCSENTMRRGFVPETFDM
ncbi:1-pyrroline-5-carboxylate dehydrogenase [Poriferisphaera corsica]|uniref:L-glutamate gamma-semialdehyde dehydrogenase n=1 Tax=Poriferisphaera corsica TaxID=2528020 RepID=A0A517YQ50_9BACT|nr:aldehyde dehydrogenase family protein [Poriferisphaera corsica]QDU32349.1 1-pyrroline-5-carboxylate dehydrogenase [Poriferisphaera corsica]